MGLFTKIFGTYSSREIKRVIPTVNKIEALADTYKAYSDEELRGVTPKLKARLAAGESLNDILPDAFAAVREAADRVLGKRPFRVQLIGGIILHQGRIAEMKTGEGKTLVATMPAYLNALTGKGVHIVTVNEYLARLGAEEMGRVYGFLGLTTGLIYHGMRREEKQAAYNADITYGTNNEFGFDYLRDNMVLHKEGRFQRGHVFAIVDEVDSILIDEARTPLIISGEGEKPTDLYEKANRLVAGMRAHRVKEIDKKQSTDVAGEDDNADYIVDEKANTAVLTTKGIRRVEAFFGLENYSAVENATIAHHVNQALKAHGTMKRDVDYMVKDNEVLIVDTFTGRIMPGRRFSDGLHQAIEAKEGVEVQKENRTLATITFQNYFRLYRKLSGMTGTALTEDNEFREIYSLDVVEIPTNLPMIRKDLNDAIYRTVDAKYNAIIEQVVACHEKGQPVLVGTVSIEKSEELSRRLQKKGIPHNVLNAKQHEKESEIVAMAGKKGKVTIATNMAGRGTDIMLGGNPEFLAKQEMKRLGFADEVIGLAVGSSLSVSEEVLAAREIYKSLYASYKEEIAPEAKEVIEAGGLYIIGTERHESRRIDNQLRGRSGRQGDPGVSKFYLSFEDDLFRLFAGDRAHAIASKLTVMGDDSVEAGVLTNLIENAQKRQEERNFQRRKYVLSYDDVMNQQRKIIYQQRDEVLDGDDIHEKLLTMIRQTVEEAVELSCVAEDPRDWALSDLRARFIGCLFTEKDLNYTEEELAALEKKTFTEELVERALATYESKRELFGDRFPEIERIVLLQTVDEHWMDHIDAMEDLKSGIGLNAYANRNPVDEYRIVGADMFDEMVHSIRDTTVRRLLSLSKAEENAERKAVARVTNAGFAGDKAVQSKKVPIRRKAPKIGPNEKCPCGSGKKYKLCCGARD